MAWPHRHSSCRRQQEANNRAERLDKSVWTEPWGAESSPCGPAPQPSCVLQVKRRAVRHQNPTQRREKSPWALASLGSHQEPTRTSTDPTERGSRAMFKRPWPTSDCWVHNGLLRGLRRASPSPARPALLLTVAPNGTPTPQAPAAHGGTREAPPRAAVLGAGWEPGSSALLKRELKRIIYKSHQI